jgi:hypothetical protein
MTNVEVSEVIDDREVKLTESSDGEEDVKPILL